LQFLVDHDFLGGDAQAMLAAQMAELSDWIQFTFNCHVIIIKELFGIVKWNSEIFICGWMKNGRAGKWPLEIEGLRHKRIKVIGRGNCAKTARANGQKCATWKKIC